jgi:carbohydrate kinase (thermoresistant glucokinase family)
MILIVMGVTGSGKTTLGQALATELALPFYDADDFHPDANRQKLRANIPLDDNDRWPWLELLAENIAEWEIGGGAVLACSALKHKYRKVLMSHTHAKAVRFIYLEATRQQIVERLRHRRSEGHALIDEYDAIVDGQFRDLQPPADAIRVRAEWTVERATGAVAEQLS